MAAGNVSFEDCDMFTSSFGWMGFLLPITPPAISIARFEITSLTFMFVCVPLPVCQMRKGKCALSLPEMTSSAACTMSWAFSRGSFPKSWFTNAQAFLRMPKA
jgi:hypothetical protein